MARSIKIATTPSAELTPIGSAQERDYDSIVDYVAANPWGWRSPLCSLSRWGAWMVPALTGM